MCVEVVQGNIINAVMLFVSLLAYNVLVWTNFLASWLKTVFVLLPEVGLGNKGWVLEESHRCVQDEHSKGKPCEWGASSVLWPYFVFQFRFFLNDESFHRSIKRSVFKSSRSECALLNVVCFSLFILYVYRRRDVTWILPRRRLSCFLVMLIVWLNWDLLIWILIFALFLNLTFDSFFNAWYYTTYLLLFWFLFPFSFPHSFSFWFPPERVLRYLALLILKWVSLILT